MPSITVYLLKYKEMGVTFHTAIELEEDGVLQNTEVHFGEKKIEFSKVGFAGFSKAAERVYLGVTQKTRAEICEKLETMKEVFSKETYRRFSNNCNNFTDAFGEFLGIKMPMGNILHLPKKVAICGLASLVGLSLSLWLSFRSSMKAVFGLIILVMTILMAIIILIMYDIKEKYKHFPIERFYDFCKFCSMC